MYDCLNEAHEPLHGLRVIMGEEQALSGVQLLDLRHLTGSQLEVKDVKILLHPILVDRLGNDHHIALQQEAQSDLGGAFAVLRTDLLQGGRIEEVVLSLGKGSPGHDLRAVLLEVLLGDFLLLEDVGFHLIDGGLDLGEVVDIQEPVRIEVGHADSPHFTFPKCLLHSAVGAVVIAEGLVDQQKVDIAGPKLFQGFVDRRLCLLIAAAANRWTPS